MSFSTMCGIVPITIQLCRGWENLQVMCSLNHNQRYKRESCLDVFCKLDPRQNISMCNATDSSIESDINDHYFKNPKEVTIGHSSSAIDLNENIDEKFFKATDLTLKICRVRTWELAEEVLHVLTVTPLTKMDCHVYLQNMEFCKEFVELRSNERLLGFNRHPRTISTVSRVGVTERRTFSWRDTQEILR